MQAGKALRVLVTMSLCVRTLSTIGSAWDDLYPDMHVEGQVSSPVHLVGLAQAVGGLRGCGALRCP